MLVGMPWRAAIALIAIVATGCGLLEPSASDLVHGASAKMQSARTVHFDGTASFALKGATTPKAPLDYASLSFDMKLTGDVELPDRSRMTMRMSLFGQSLEMEIITLGGTAYAKDAKTGVWTEASTSSNTAFLGMMPADPLGNLDLSNVAGIVEVDRPDVDGRKTRHFRYAADPITLTEAMRKTAGSSPLPFANPTGSGELWIRVDDGQIVRQTVKVAFEIGDLSSLIAGAPIPGAVPGGANSTFELGFDFRFSRHGETIPAITAPRMAAPATGVPSPTKPPVRTGTLPPNRTGSPLPTR